MQLPARLGRYELVRLLGEGGAGRVYEAVLHGPAGFRKRVAVKLLKDGGRGLLREARLGGLLQHPNLVEVYALEEVEGTWVCAMELITGGSLRKRLPLPSRAVVEVGLQVCAGLQRAHVEVGLVHLDLKPANLLLQGAVVKIADFGFARAHGFPGERQISGTPAYMAPEQRAGQAVDARADVYSLGVVLVELATGRPGRDPMRVPWLADVLERCLAPDPNQRFRNAGEVAQALAALDLPGEGLSQTFGQPGNPHSSGSFSRPVPTSRDTYTFLVELAPTTNIGVATDRLFGRAPLLAEIGRRLSGPTLLTLKGTGGLGKTRLARTAARAWHDAGHGQAWFVDLADARSRDDVVVATAGALGVELTGAASGLVDRVGRAIGGRGPVLVVLDNFEQVVGEAALVDRWRALAPEARWLVTTREALGLRDEQVLEPEPLTEAEGAALLVERTAELGGTLDPADPDLAALVRALDGLPLALELAASRLTLMSPGSVLARLEDRFRLLRSRRRDLAPRQATLRAALEWSWEWMTEAERAGFAQCAVFAGGFTVEAGEAVLEVPGDAWALDVVDALVRKSLLTQRDGRLYLFETTRAFAVEKLEGDEARLRHAAWYGQLGSHAAEKERQGPRAAQRTAELIAEQPNLLAAVDHALALGAVDDAARCALAASTVFDLRGPLSAWTELVERVLAAEPMGPGLRGRLERAACSACAQSGRPEEALGHAEAAARIHRAQGDVQGEGIARNNQALVLADLGRMELAHERALEAIRLVRQAGDRRFEGVAIGNLGSLETELGRVGPSLHHQLESLQILDEVGDRRAAARTLGNLGNSYGARGDLETAVGYFERAIVAYRKLGATRLEAISLGNLSTVLTNLGQHERAIARGRASVRLSREAGDRRNLGVGLATLSRVLAQVGRVAEAREACTEALDLLREAGDSVWVAIARGYLGRYALATGQADLAVEHLVAAVEGTEGRHSLAHAGLLASLGEARVASGGRERGLADIYEAIERLEAGDYRDELAEARQALERALRSG